MRKRIPATALGLVVLVYVAAWAADPAAPGPSTPLYTVKDGNKVDDKTLEGWKTWRAMACERCHGPEQQGLVGPSLVDAFKTLSQDDFHAVITQGRVDKGMPNFGGVALVQQNWQNLYAYLKGRSDGKIAPGHLYPMNAADAPPPPEGWKSSQ